MSTRRFAGIIRIQLPTGEHVSFPDAVSPQVQNAAYRSRYNASGLSQADLFHLASCAEFLALLESPRSMSMLQVVESLRRIRRAVSTVDLECDVEVTP